MLIKNLFERDIFRPINGVVKADQLDDSSVWQELDEFVVTRELDQHLRKFVAWYLEAVDQAKTAPTGKMGVWISGFFGSGKSHFLKVLSYLLRNRTHAHDGNSRPAVEFFQSKVADAMLFGDIKRAVAGDTDVVLFNIDSKADHGTGRDLILRVFLKVLNELQGYSGELSGGEEAKLLGEIVFDDVLKGQRKHRFSANKMDFEFNRRCDGVPIGNQRDGALLVAVVSPLADDYDAYDKTKCLMASSPQGPEGGYVLAKLANDESLGRELRGHIQTEKYLAWKNDGTLPESTKRILRSCAEDNRQRRDRLTVLLGDLLAGAEYFVAGQPLKPKGTDPESVLAEAMEYLIQNTFGKMSHLKRLAAEPLKELQEVLRNSDLNKPGLFPTGESNPQAVEDLRNYLDLCSKASRQVVLHDMIEKRYALRPYGWPDEEVLILVGRLLMLGEIALMTDGVAVPPEKVYESITTPAKRRKVVLVKRVTADPKTLQSARSLGKELFAEMGPDGEDALFAFLQIRLKGWQTNLNAYKPLADTGDYPGGEAITDGLALVNKLTADKDSFKFVERFNTLRKDLLDFADRYHDLEHFYGHQKPTWEKLRKAHAAFQHNRLELERDEKAGPALKRMREILSAPSPYVLVKDADGLIGTVSAVNSALLTSRRKQAVEKIDAHYATLTKDMAAVNADPALRAACLKPLESLKQQVEKEESLAHVTQAEAEAVAQFDAGIARIEEFARKLAEKPGTTGIGPTSPPPVVKKQKIVKPAELVAATYLETQAEVDAFLAQLRVELEKAIAQKERIVIR